MLVETFKLPPNFIANFLIHLVICSAEINHQTTYEKPSLFVLFFVCRKLKFEYLYIE